MSGFLAGQRRGEKTLRDVLDKGGNRGLAFGKFVSWAMGSEFGGQAKTDTIKQFAARPAGKADELKRATKRMDALATACGGAARDLTAQSRFVTGLGIEHPLENGFAWHHTLGVPHLPGSGIKGMMRAFAQHWGGLGLDDPRVRIAQLFGVPGEDAGHGIGVGRLVVFDALPLAPVQLVAEVLTPHDGGWRLKGPGDAAPYLSPGDWHDPVPVPYLAVEKGQAYRFALGLSRHGTPDDLAEGWILLESALEWIGFGAKTAIGFGRFMTADRLRQKEQADKAELQAARAQAVEAQKAAKPAASASRTLKVGDIVRQLDEDRPTKMFVEIVGFAANGDLRVMHEGGRDAFPVERANCEYADNSWATLKRR